MRNKFLIETLCNMQRPLYNSSFLQNVTKPVNLDVLSIAPMIDWTYSSFRMWMRFLAPHAFLYTEMQTTGAIQHNPQRALFFNPQEHPLVLQLGGSNKEALVASAIQAQEAGFDEVNLNLGCPSDKVQAGRFGACLMNEPDHVMACISALKQAVSIPVTSKIRIGIDHNDSYDFFRSFALKLVEAGSDKLIVHARKAWLNGLSPKQNRTIPPVQYDFVYKIKAELADVPVIINGNINELDAIKHHLHYVDGVMLGRLACDNPYQIALIHHALYPKVPLRTRSELFQQYIAYMRQEFQHGTSISLLIKPIFNLTHGLAGASLWKQQLMKIIQTKDLGLLDELMAFLINIEESVYS